MVYACEHCQKKCRSSRGLSQHIQRTPHCQQKQAEKLGSRSSNNNSNSRNAHSSAEAPDPGSPAMHRRPNKRRKEAGLGDYCAVASDSGGMEVADIEFDFAPNPGDSVTEFEDEVPPTPARPTESDVDDLDPSDETSKAEDEAVKVPPNVQLLEDFRAYCEHGVKQTQPFDEYTVTSIKLLEQLRQCKAPMCAYENMLEWHLKETGHLRDDSMTLKDTKKYFSRATLLKKLAKRYNCEALAPKLKRVRLPSSKAVASIPCREAKDVIVSLLTDPRVEDEVLSCGCGSHSWSVRRNTGHWGARKCLFPSKATG